MAKSVFAECPRFSPRQSLMPSVKHAFPAVERLVRLRVTVQPLRLLLVGVPNPHPDLLHRCGSSWGESSKQQEGDDGRGVEGHVVKKPSHLELAPTA